MDQTTALTLVETIEQLNRHLEWLGWLIALLIAVIVSVMLLVEWRIRKASHAPAQSEFANADSADSEHEQRFEPFDADLADDLYARDQLDQLIDYCQTHHERYPNEVAVYWFLGLAYYRRTDYAHAKINFEHVIELNPAWRESVGGYLQEISQNNLVHEQPEHPLQ